MSDLQQAKDLFLQGVTLFENGQFEAAHGCFEQALVLAPGRPSVLLNLGITRMQLGRWQQALAPLEESLASQPDQLDGWVALGMVQNRLGHLSPALEAYVQVQRLAPEQALGWGEAASLLREMNRLDEAAAHYERALTIAPDHELYSYYLSALRGQGGPEQAPRAYVQSLFEQYADDFEPHLLGPLQYRGHSHLIAQLPAQVPTQFARVLDLGCGTGLCGPLIRPRAGALWGIDLAQGMIDQAQKRGVYDHLQQADAAQFLANCKEPWNLVLAADVFIYIGALEPLFEQLSRLMPAQSWLAFTAELDESAGVHNRPRLLPSLRYAHPLRYLQECAQAHGFDWHSHHQAPLRLDQGEPMMALYAYLQRR
ncbi:MAG: tetratricopeptide repeat protein [Betaproteobacteria bacterium]